MSWVQAEPSELEVAGWARTRWRDSPRASRSVAFLLVLLLLFIPILRRASLDPNSSTAPPAWLITLFREAEKDVGLDKALEDFGPLLEELGVSAGDLALAAGYVQPAGAGSEQIGPGSPIPSGLIPVFNEAARVFDVNPYLLASVADQESSFGAPDSRTPNYDDCVGFMQTCIGGAGGDSWHSTVQLTGPDAKSVYEPFAYTYGERPPSYPGQSDVNPAPAPLKPPPPAGDYNDPFDAVMAGAVELRGKVGGAPIPNLDSTAYRALCGYYGACADSVAVYAPTVLARAQQWQSESALKPATSPGGIELASSVLPLAPGDRARVLPNGLAAAPADAPQAVKNLIAAGNQIVGKPYLYGGGHGLPLSQIASNYDCSSSVEHLLWGGGFLPTNFSAASGELAASFGVNGYGHWITILANSDHVYLYVAGIRWDTHNVVSSDVSPSDPGIGWHTGTRDDIDFTPRHPAGF